MTERVLGPRRSRRRKTRLLTLTALVAAVFTVFFVVGSAADNAGGCDFAPTGTTLSCLGALSGSTFAGGDGNLLTSPTTFGTTDWQNVAGLHTGIDLPSGSGDNSFGQGSKTDDPNITVVNGSIPPQKSDLTRFYEASEVGSNPSDNFLYLGWERTNNLGSANFNFEINQKTQPDLTTPGDKTLVRTAGDLLVTFDFDNGGGRPTVALLRWLTSATVPVVPNFASNACFSANGFPCWGDKVTLDGSDSIAAVNNLNAVTDPFVSNTPNNIGALRFGETAIDLTKAGVFPSGTCTAFGSAMVTGRSSSAFTAEIKDFIAPTPVNITNCGTVNIIKHSDPRGVDQNFSYTSTIPNPASGSTTPDCSLDTTPSAFTLNDDAGTDPASPITQGTANTEHCVNVPNGSYTVTEGAEPASFVLESLSCTADTGSSGSQHAAGSPQADITLAPGGTVTCTYTNQLQQGAIKITKTGKDKACTGLHTPDANCASNGVRNLSGASFVIKKGGNSITGGSLTTTDGVACLDHLAFGTDYTVQETGAPTGYKIDNPAVSSNITVNKNSTCGDGNEANGGAYTDTPLSKITVSFDSVKDGATTATINCTGDQAGVFTNLPEGTPRTLGDGTSSLVPDEVNGYTCTVKIDP